MQDFNVYPQDATRSYLREDAEKIDLEEPNPENFAESGGMINIRMRQEKGPLYKNEFYLYEVEFKKSKDMCEKTAFCAEDFEIGDYIKVECDRNHELGVVCNILVMSSESTPFFGENGRANFRKILGRATQSEKRIFLTKIRDEERALHICNELVTRKRLPITVLDATFQLDRTKLTFFYMSNKRVDFRDLVRNLFSLYKTRIWMQKLDVNGNPIHSSFSSNDPNAAALTPQRIQQSRRDSNKVRGSNPDYFDPQMEDDFSDEYSPPPQNTRSNPRSNTTNHRGGGGGGGGSGSGRGGRDGHGHGHSTSGYRPSRNSYSSTSDNLDVIDVNVYIGEDRSVVAEVEQFETMNNLEIEKIIRSSNPWATYPNEYSYPPPQMVPAYRPRHHTSYPPPNMASHHEANREFYGHELSKTDDGQYSATMLPSPRGSRGYGYPLTTDHYYNDSFHSRNSGYPGSSSSSQGSSPKTNSPIPSREWNTTHSPSLSTLHAPPYDEADDFYYQPQPQGSIRQQTFPPMYQS